MKSNQYVEEIFALPFYFSTAHMGQDIEAT
jgi:hypothetical protein